MTSTVERRPVARTSVRRPAASTSTELFASGALAAAWALGAGLVAFAVPVLLIWAADRRSGAGAVEASRLAGQLWLLAHGCALRVGNGVVGLVPLGLTALPLALLHRAGRHAARQHAVPAARLALGLTSAIALPYALVATCLTALVSTGVVMPDPVRALLLVLLVAFAGAGSGVLREAGLFEPLRRFFPERVRAVASGAAIAVAVVLAAGAVLVVLSVLLHLSRVSSLTGATGPGLVGGTGLVVFQLLLLPNAAAWGAAWLAGPGFAVGVGTSVGPFGVTLGPLPALPVLGALPTAPPAAGWLCLVVPVLAGVAGAVVVRRRAAAASLPDAALDGAVVAVGAGLLMALAALLSGGPLGSGRLAAVGPSPWRVGLALAASVAVGAVLTLLASTWWSARRS